MPYKLKLVGSIIDYKWLTIIAVKISTIGKIRFIVIKQTKQSWHNIYLLNRLIINSGFNITWSVKNNRYRRTSERSLVFWIYSKQGSMIGSNYKNCIFKLRLILHNFKEITETHICLASGLLKRSFS